MVTAMEPRTARRNRTPKQRYRPHALGGRVVSAGGNVRGHAQPVLVDGEQIGEVVQTRRGIDSVSWWEARSDNGLLRAGDFTMRGAACELAELVVLARRLADAIGRGGAAP